jgi:2-enoate reductase
MIKKIDIDVTLNRKIDVNDIISMSPDAVIIATGSRPIKPDIPGIELPFVYDFIEIYKNMPELGRNIVIVGGGDIGCETADMLASAERNITIIEILSDVLSKMKDIPRHDLLNRLKQKNIKILTGIQVTSIETGKVWIQDREGNRSFINADCVIISTGSRVENLMFEPLSQKISEVYTVGDAAKTGNVGDALRSAARLALKI